MEQYQRNWKNYYEILQLSPNAESVVITAAYRRLAQLHHPDTAKKVSASKRMIDINEAYEVLSNPSRKAEYDHEFNRRQPSQEYISYNSGSKQQTSDRQTASAPRTRTQYATHKQAAYRGTAQARYSPQEAKNEAPKRKEGGTQIGWGLLMLIVGGLGMASNSTASGLSRTAAILSIVGLITLAVGLENRRKS